MGAALGLLESAAAAVRAKGLLTAALLGRASPRLLLAACSAKLLPQVCGRGGTVSRARTQTRKGTERTAQNKTDP